MPIIHFYARIPFAGDQLLAKLKNQRCLVSDKTAPYLCKKIDKKRIQ